MPPTGTAGFPWSIFGWGPQQSSTHDPDSETAIQSDKSDSIPPSSDNDEVLPDASSTEMEWRTDEGPTEDNSAERARGSGQSDTLLQQLKSTQSEMRTAKAGERHAREELATMNERFDECKAELKTLKRKRRTGGQSEGVYDEDGSDSDSFEEPDDVNDEDYEDGPPSKRRKNLVSNRAQMKRRRGRR